MGSLSNDLELQSTRHAPSFLLRGAGSYVADLEAPGLVEAGFARSWEAHGRLVEVNLAEARTLPGVLGAWGASDLPDLPPTPPTVPNRPPPGMERPSLASTRVRYVGEPVAVVVAENRYTAEDGVEAALVDIDPLPAVAGLPALGHENEAPLFEGLGNVVLEGRLGNDISGAFEGAEMVVEGVFNYPRLAPSSIETRGILVIPDGADGLEVWCSHQAPHRLRDGLALALGLDPSRVRVRIPNVGGAFGAKSQLYPEYVVTAYLAISLDRPVRWIEDRKESFIAASHGRAQRHVMRLAADGEGRLLALDARIDGDVGAYPHTGAFIPAISAAVSSGPYRIPNIAAAFRSILTNAPPTSPYRGAGRPETATSLEVLIDRLASRLDLDPAEIRRRNFIQRDEFPYESPTGESYDSGNYAAGLERAVELAGYGSTPTTDRGGNPNVLVGVGMASFIEKAGGQSNSSEFGSVEVSDGLIVARSGSLSTGQGHGTTFARIVASIFEVDEGVVRIVEGDTDLVATGTGTFGSRSVQLGGSALQRASIAVLEEARQRAGDLLEVAVEDLEYRAGAFRVVGAESRLVSIWDLVDHGDGPLEASDVFVSDQTYPSGTYIATVEIDAETGALRFAKVVAVDDCGTVVDPEIAEGQVLGSIAQGVGSVLYEELRYDDSGQPVVTSLMDYLMPTIAEMPPIQAENVETPSLRNPLGAKGAGEAGCIGIPGAVVNAIRSALGAAAHGDPDVRLPIVPEEIWGRLQGSGRMGEEAR